MNLRLICGKIKRTLVRLEEIKCSSKCSYGYIVADYCKMRKKLRCSFYEYYIYDLLNASSELRETFLSNAEKARLLSVLNPRRYFIVARNKYLAHCLFDAVGIPSAELLVYYDPMLRSLKDGCACDYDSVVGLLKAKNVRECVVKQPEESHGTGVLLVRQVVFKEGECLLVLHDGTEKLLREVLGKSPLLFEAVVRQNAQMASLNSSSVNTIRFMTCAYPDGTSRVIATFVKVGRAGCCVDNAGDGGNVDAGIDVQYGTIYNALEFNGFRKIRKVDVHPDSGAQMTGVVIENWVAIKRKLEECQNAFPFLKAAGWDVALTDNGPVIIEVNDFWDETGQLFLGRGWKREIEECYSKWRQYYRAK